MPGHFHRHVHTEIKSSMSCILDFLCMSLSNMKCLAGSSPTVNQEINSDPLLQGRVDGAAALTTPPCSHVWDGAMP